MRVRQIQNLFKGRNQVAVIMSLITFGPGLACSESADFGEGEILDPPVVAASLHTLTVGKFRMVGDIGGGREIMVMPYHQYAIRGHHQVRLDHVGALFDGQCVALDRVFGAVATGTAMGDHKWRLAVERSPHTRCRRLILGGTGGHSSQYAKANKDLSQDPLPFPVQAH
jgi:hypothetical protein